MTLFRVDAPAALAALVASSALASDLIVPQQFGTIQEAINAAANGDRVLVSAGVYHEQVNLSGKGIQLLGVDGATATAIDGDHSRTVIVGYGEPSTCLVQGFTIQNGRDYGYTNGGGVRIYNSSVRVDSCRFIGNHAESPGWWGAGAWRSEYGSPQITNCTFAKNYGAGGAKPGIYHYLGGEIHISDCVFSESSSVSGSAESIHIQTEGGTISASIQRCVFRRSQTQGNGGFFIIGFWNPYNGSVTCPISDCVVESPIYPADTPPSIAAFMGIGSYPNSPYNITLTNIRPADCRLWSLQTATPHGRMVAATHSRRIAARLIWMAMLT
jgi:hypothetical protein